jgi:hypothetical protein
MLQIAGVSLLTFSACLRQTAVLTQATKGTERGHIAVATRQKSTARRLVSICTVLEGTYLMLFSEGTAVTTRSAVMALIVA